MDRTYIELLLDQWGIANKPWNVKSLRRSDNNDVVFCDQKDLEFVEWALCKIGQKNRRRMNIVKHKYTARELDANSRTIPISDSMVGLHFSRIERGRVSADEIRIEIDAAIRQIIELSGERTVERSYSHSLRII